MSADRSAPSVRRGIGIVFLGLAATTIVASALARLLRPEAADQLAIIPTLGRAWEAQPLPLIVLLATPFVAALVTALGAGRGRVAAAPIHADEPAAVAAAEPDPHAGGLQVLALLQREGRFIDFIEESLEPYSDEQVGSAVRAIHEGCRTALRDRLELRPVLVAEEGTTVTIERGFDPAAIRVTGNVRGEPPYEGVLRHPGWQASRMELPTPTGSGSMTIIAPAEVELP